MVTSAVDGLPRRSLVPREHGAYGQLGLPLVVALMTGSGSGAAWLSALAALVLFFAHEPLLVVLGQRGSASASHRRRARIVLTLDIAFGTCCMGLALWLAPAGRLAASAAFPGSLSLASGALLRVGRERTTLGELCVAATLPALAVPVAVAGGVPLSGALHAWSAWWLGISAATAAVRGVLGHTKRGQQRMSRLALPVAAAAAVVALAVLRVLPLGESVATVPMLIGALWLAAWPPRPRHLRKVGWALVGASTLTAMLLIFVALG